MDVAWNQSYKNRDIPWQNKGADLSDILQRSKIQNGNALDLGCGTGEFSIWLSQHGFVVEGIDGSPEALKIASGNNSSVIWKLWDLEDFRDAPLQNEQYELIIDIKVLPFIEDKRKYLSVVAEKLSSSGAFVVISFLHHKAKPEIAIDEKELDLLLGEFFIFQKNTREFSDSLIAEYICSKLVKVE